MAKITGWQKGCLVAGLGCVSVIVLVVTVTGIALVWAASSARRLGDPTPDPVSRTIARSDRSANDRDAARGDDSNDDRQDDRRGNRRDEPPVEASLVLPDESGSDEPLRLRIDMQEGRFEVRPGPAGSELRVDGTYASTYYELTDERDEDADGSRSLTIRFRSSRSLPVRLFAGLMAGRGNPNRLTVSIPEDLLIDLSLRFGSGQSEIDLGGLNVTELDGEFSMGQHEVEFSRPTAREMRGARLDGQMGEVSFRDLGNARAVEFDITTGMGEGRVDLGGTWQSDAEVSIRHSMGDLRVDVPNEIRLSESSRVRVNNETRRLDRRRETDLPDAPEIQLRLTASMGEARVRRY